VPTQPHYHLQQFNRNSDPSSLIFIQEQPQQQVQVQTQTQQTLSPRAPPAEPLIELPLTQEPEEEIEELTEVPLFNDVDSMVNYWSNIASPGLNQGDNDCSSYLYL
jgi:hypothetical protein